MDRYTLTATARADASSKFGKNHRFGFFPSVSGAWVISNERWMQRLKFVNNAKLRIGYGLTGNLGGIGQWNDGVLAIRCQPAAATHMEYRATATDREVEYLLLFREAIRLDAGKSFRTVIFLIEIQVQLPRVELTLFMGRLFTVVHQIKILRYAFGQDIDG
jgi:hypothetical protein